MPHSSQPPDPNSISATERASASTTDNGLVVRSPALQQVMRLAEKVARHPAAVLIVGETGTGKEMIAHAIHNHSLRCNQPFIDVNCAAIPEHLVESELFGYEKGAFSGADAMKPGMFELAHKGTLFLDEIGDLDQKIQVKLLRVLDGVPYFRLGGNKKVGVDVRVVAATNQDLEGLVQAGRFRGDLYHRLAQFKLELPPLRERPEDVLGIAQQVLHQHYPESSFSQDAVEALLSYSWPGNIRELKNIIFGAVLQARNAEIEIAGDDLRFPEGVSESRKTAVTMDAGLDEMERKAILLALEKTGGKQGKAAAALGISRRTLLRKLKAYREAGVETPGGTLSVNQQRYYRAQVEVPIRIKYAGEHSDAALLNISAGGAGIKTETSLKSGAPVALLFPIPGSDAAAEFPGRITWTNKSGQYGIQFEDLSTSLRTSLQRWLRAEMKKDGWDLDSGE
ncbi:MAG TPA: sigma 54-interacting transcriptional regulator [Candidatus Angelobacter sp.]|nr:sigma 54-interacting transcriptional regulator [Candidatus Angelobacter sp.]